MSVRKSDKYCCKFHPANKPRPDSKLLPWVCLTVMQFVSIRGILCNQERIFISDADRLKAYDGSFKCNAWRKHCKFGYHCFDMSGMREVSFSFILSSMAVKQSMTFTRRLWLAFQKARPLFTKAVERKYHRWTPPWTLYLVLQLQLWTQGALFLCKV